jgi:hypothetical protein
MAGGDRQGAGEAGGEVAAFRAAAPVVSIARLPQTTTRLFGRDADLAWLEACWAEGATPWSACRANRRRLRDRSAFSTASICEVSRSSSISSQAFLPRMRVDPPRTHLIDTTGYYRREGELTPTSAPQEPLQIERELAVMFDG